MTHDPSSSSPVRRIVASVLALLCAGALALAATPSASTALASEQQGATAGTAATTAGSSAPVPAATETGSVSSASSAGSVNSAGTASSQSPAQLADELLAKADLSPLIADSPASNDAERAFDAYLLDQLGSQLVGSYANLHTLLQDPASFGIDPHAVAQRVGWEVPGSYEDMDTLRTEVLDALQKLLAIDKEQLGDDRRGIYDTLELQLEVQVQLSDPKYDYYQQVFGPTNGFYAQLPSILGDWRVESTGDLDDLVTMLQDTRRYVGELLGYAQQQVSRGTLIADAATVAQTCQGVADEGQDSPTLAALLDKVDALGLDATQASSYKEQITRAFTGSYLPAFSDAASFFSDVDARGLARNGSLASLPNGPAFFELQLQLATGTDLTLDEMWDEVADALSSSMDDLTTLAGSDPSLVSVLTGGVTLNYTSYEQILDQVQQKMGADYPAVSDLSYTITDLDESVAATMTSVYAYFSVPPLDADDAVKVMRVNPLYADLSSFQTFVTVTHEGFPGHMYQYAYAYQDDLLKVGSTLTSSLGYAEGYATYASLGALSYMDGLTSAQADIYRANDLLTNYAGLLIDFGVNGYGWTVDDLASFYADLGVLSDTDLQNPDILATVQADWLSAATTPAVMEPYYFGYLQIADLKAEAKQALGPAFTEKGFNEAILSRGSVTFDVVDEAVRDYVSQAGAGSASIVQPGTEASVAGDEGSTGGIGSLGDLVGALGGSFEEAAASQAQSPTGRPSEGLPAAA